ncbi:hypothetical protein NQ318_005988 [Aromia moschata]|uniref:Transcription elongation factor B polypeptide 3 n=1 Tax=Aromia moschata TaxID=1265417 RepID=A0AAV8Y002_9CUCU|nr:hypothetical protein NQ318_005988 [Aromia moschata]
MEPVSTAYSTENDTENYEESGGESEEFKNLENVKISSHGSGDEKKEGNSHSVSNNKHTSGEKRDKHKDKHNSSSKRKKECADDRERQHKSKKRHMSYSSESDEEYEESHSKQKPHHKHRSESSDDSDYKKHKSKKSKHSNDTSESEDSYKEFKLKSSESNKDCRDSRKSKLNEKTENKRHDYETHLSMEAKSKRHKFEYKFKEDSGCEMSKSNGKHKSKKRFQVRNRRSKGQKSKSQKEKKESKSAEFKEKPNSKKEETRTSEEKHKTFKDEKENERKEKNSNNMSKSGERSKSSSTNSKHKSSSDNKKREAVKHVDNEKIVNGIDSGSGASFADALGMCEPVMSIKTFNNKKKKHASVSSPEKRRASSSHAKPEKNDKYEVEDDDEDNVPPLLKQEPPEPLNINISSLLPEITPHYKPLGLPVESQPRRILTPDEALSQAISNKNIRTKVYSGNKSYGKVETLFDLCVRILQDNIDALEYTGGVPYSILKPVLERATPDQLFNMEHHNPYLIQDTDDLWQLHCQKEFRTKKREELESWREMYMRCLDEREARLNAITANIKQSQDKSIPVRTTKLAYVDSVVKPPRNIARKQAKNGIVFDKKPTLTPSSRLSALATAGDAGKVAVPNPGSRAVERSSNISNAVLKPKKAPLMAKTLSLFKNRFRR